MKVNQVLTRLYPFSRIHLMKNRTVELSRCTGYDPDTHTLYRNGHEDGSRSGKITGRSEAIDSEHSRVAGVAKGFASQCGYVYDAGGTLIHGLTHKYRPNGNYKPLSRVCEKVTGQRQSVFGFSYFPGDIAVATASTQRYYYHWLVDVLPRIAMIRSTGFDGPVYVDNSMPFQRETIECVWPGMRIVDARSNPMVTADRLIVPVHQVHRDGVFPDWIVKLLRERVLGLSARETETRRPAGAYPRRIYVIRNQSARRCVANESELRDKLTAYGFSCLAMEDMSVGEQAQHFFNAEVIVAPHGGGLTNLVFARKGATCVELFGRYDKACYEAICRAVDVAYRRLHGSVERDETGRFHEDFAIDPDAVASVLDAMGVTRRTARVATTGS